MLRWTLMLSLLLGLVGVPGTSWLTSRALADDVLTTTTPSTTDSKPADQPAVKPADQPAATDQTTKTSDQPIVAKPVEQPNTEKPSKLAIHDLLEDGKVKQAEDAYLEWASYWHDDDAALIVLVERAVLEQQFKDGKNGALLALAQSGDKEAMNIITAKALSGGSNWTPTDMAPAIKLMAKSTDKNTENTLRTLLYYKDAPVVNATIEVLGSLGDRRMIPVLYRMFDDADAERSVYLTFALARLGDAKQVRARFQPQLRFPMPGAREKAALVLAALGDPICWPMLNRILQEKKAPYYPLALITLSSLPFPDSQSYVTQALAGSEAEQLAALKSLSILPPENIESTLISLLRDTAQPLSVRQFAVQLLTERKSQRALKEMLALAQVVVPMSEAQKSAITEHDLRTLTEKYYGSNPQDKAAAMKAQAPVAAAAMKSLTDYGLLKDFIVRESIRQQFANPEDEIARAARVALYNYALSVTAANNVAKAKK